MITAFELLRLALEGNLEKGYEVLTLEPKISFEEKLGDIVCYNYDYDDICVCVGKLPHCVEVGYLVKQISDIPSRMLLGAPEAIYEVDTKYDGTLYYAVWAITNE